MFSNHLSIFLLGVGIGYAHASLPTPSSHNPTKTSTTVASQTGASFPSTGSVPRDFSPAGLDKLWDIVRYLFLYPDVI